ncbi:MAG: extracellular solute-binding protein [Desulfotomaculum sp.]|nr:extracellular solute-binding protein [Desulfotomaculum sp.]MCL0081143.1 extracellular solute-binding protein [Peptococcaceae bacterium]
MTQKLKILHAGALKKPMFQFAKLFKNRYQDLQIEIEAHGSRVCARQVKNGKQVDIIALADTHIFEDILMPQYVNKYYIFANDQIVLAYDYFSKNEADINQENWLDILLSPEVVFGRSDEVLDPCGCRTLLVWQLAEKYYQKTGLQNKLKSKCVDNKIYPKSYDAALSVSEGRLDYAFIYLCVANRFGLKYITLPEKINLSNPAYLDYYCQASVEVQGEEPNEVDIITGAPIEFAIAVTKNAENCEIAKAFLELVLSKKGQLILEDCGLIPY